MGSKPPEEQQAGSAGSRFYGSSTDYMSRLRASGGRAYARVARHALWRWRPPQTSSRVLDFGCGTGEFSRLLVGVGYRVVGVDVSPLFLRDARARHGDRPGLGLVQGDDGGRLPFATGSFDGLVAVNVIEHVEEPGTVLAELARVLQPGGIAVLTFPNLLSPLRPLKRFVSRERLARYGPESGNSVGESLRLVLRDVGLLLTRAVLRRPHFVPREADFAHANLYYELGYGADYDAVWLCNPLDVTWQLRQVGVQCLECAPFAVARETHLGRLGRVRTRLPATLSSPILWVGRKEDFDS